ncbi:MAG TPA: SMP-30/gluconolactonase/LRE family protein [Actinomycetota bacterium]|nr:SMP-30/gluconolactonase/LRE family protein [Actinomycetota bacterium]
MTDVELVVDCRCELGEGPVWHEQEMALYWVNINGFEQHRFDPESGEHQVENFDQHVTAVVPREKGGFVMSMRDGFALTDGFGPPAEMVAQVEKETNTRFNDGKADPAGRFIAGTMGFDAALGAGALYRFDTDYSVTRLLDGVSISNGLAWSADGSTLYYIDTLSFQVEAFDYDLETGDLSNRRQAIEFGRDTGYPDGMSIDEEGFLWVAFWGGSAVRRFSTEGKLDREIKLPVPNVSSCAFGGPDLSDLYITTAYEGLSPDLREAHPTSGSLYRASPGVRGGRAYRFKG